MDSNINFDVQRVGRAFNLSPEVVSQVAELLASGLAPAYIARHQARQLRGVHDWQIFGVKRAISEEKNIERRQQSLINHLQSADRLTPEIEAKIRAAKSTREIDILQAAWKRRRPSRITTEKASLYEALAQRAIAGQLDDAGLATELAALNPPTLPLPEDCPHSAEAAAPPAPPDTVESEQQQRDSEAGESPVSPSPGHATAPSTRPDPADVESATAASPSTAIPRDLLSDVIKDHISGRAELYEAMAKLLRDKGHVACRPMSHSDADKPSHEPHQPQDNAQEQVEFGDGVLDKANVMAPQSGSVEQVEANAVEVVDGLATTTGHVDPADIRRRRRKESRKRRRAHLENMFRDFVKARLSIDRVMPWQYLAMDHADRLRILELVIEAPRADLLKSESQKYVSPGAVANSLVAESLDEVLMHEVLPELKRLLRKELSARAQAHAAKLAATRIRELLQAPAHPVRVLAIDAIGRQDAELAVLEHDGSVILTKSWKTGENAEQRAAAAQKLKELIEKHEVRLVAIGESTRGRIHESMIAKLVSDLPETGYAMINREGAEYYATSNLASRELPQYSPKSRTAISIGRRLQDPLDELAKVEPRHLVAASWPLIPDNTLNERLGDATAMCVGRLGVDINTASESLLAHVPGLNQQIAKQIVDDRKKNGRFTDKLDIRRVEAIDDIAFKQAAGFLKVRGENGLDGSLVEPQEFELATSILEGAGLQADCLLHANAHPCDTEAIHRLDQLDQRATATLLGTEPETVSRITDLLHDSILARRETSHDHAIRQSALRFEDLEPDQDLLGTISKVVSFGVFVDLGCGLIGLCHVSQMGNHVRDPREQFAVGDLRRVEVVSLDHEQRHIALRIAGVQSGGSTTRRQHKRRSKKERPRAKPRDPSRKTMETKKRRVPDPPITDAMKKGREPMRTFGDLKQFFDQSDSQDKPSSDES